MSSMGKQMCVIYAFMRVRGKEYINVCLTILYLQCVSAGVMVRLLFAVTVVVLPMLYTNNVSHIFADANKSSYNIFALILLLCASRDTCMLAQWECKIYDIMHRDAMKL